jgi:hypothetical integral membrane protein (TIGR02206 family)
MVIGMEGLKYFFSFINAVPPRFATPAFSVRHLEVLSFFIAVYTVLTVIFKDKSEKVRSIYVLVVAFLLLFFNIVNELWLVLIGHFGVMTELPLQLCGTMYIIIPLMVLSRNRILMEFVYACGMPGAFFAMLTPDTQGYYFISWGFLIFIVIHSLIVYVPLFMLITSEFRPRFHNLHKVARLFFSLVILDLIIDHLLGSNYLYLTKAPEGTLLETFASWVGAPGYIFIAIFVVVIVWIALYLPWELFYRAQRRQVLGMEQT